MKKKVSFSGQGRRADIGEMTIHRILPNRYAEAVGPIVFLDHIGPLIYSAAIASIKDGTGAHPHRGIATLTYVLNGQGEHFDSRGHHAKVLSGGIQWMKAGNGVIHDETMKADSQTGDSLIHGLQFWINLPSQAKKEDPDYLAVDAGEVPQTVLSNNAGWLKVIAGEYDQLVSRVPAFTKQFIYHIRLMEKREFTLPTEKGLEYAAFLPIHGLAINDTIYEPGEFIEFDREDGAIEFCNTSSFHADIILFGGETYAEPIVAQGPFVMNSLQEIAEAYQDFHAGKYGTIKYNDEGR